MSTARSRLAAHAAAAGYPPDLLTQIADAALPGRFALQGNLDPLALIAGGPRLDHEVERVLDGFVAPRAHIFNLGHGILPETPVGNVERLVARVRGETSP